MSPTSPQLPAEIYAIIIELAGIEDRQAYHRLDINTLLSFRLVSKFLHALASPILYSSIKLPTHEAILKLERLSKANPRLLCHTRTLFFTSGHCSLNMGVGWLAQAIAQGAIGGAIGLQRICIAWGCPDVGAFCRRDGPSGLYEFAALHTSPSANNPNFSFPFKRLRKLALTTIDFRNSKMVTALLELWSLTHLAVDRFFNVEQPTLREIGSMFQDVDWSDLLMQNLRKYIKEAVSEPKVILGIIGKTPSHRAALIRKFDSMEPLSRVLLVPYDLEVEGSDWFPNKILDGTLWHME